MSTAFDKDYPVAFKLRPLMTKDSEINKQKMPICDLKTSKVSKMNGNLNNCNTVANKNNDRDDKNSVCRNSCIHKEDHERRKIVNSTDAVNTVAIKNELNNNSAMINTAAKQNDCETHQLLKCNGNVNTESRDEEATIATIASIVPEQRTQQQNFTQEREQQTIVALENVDFSDVSDIVSVETENVPKHHQQNETELDICTPLDSRKESTSFSVRPAQKTEATKSITVTMSSSARAPSSVYSEKNNGNIGSHVLENGHVSSSSTTSESRSGDSISSNDSSSNGCNENVIGDSGNGEKNDGSNEVSATSATSATENEEVTAINGSNETIYVDTDVISSSLGNDNNDEIAFVNRIVPYCAERFQFYVPQEIVGRLIGKGGANVNDIKSKTHAIISVLDEPTTITSKLCVIIGSRDQIKSALQMIRARFRRGFNTSPRFSKIDSYINYLPYDPNYSLNLSKSTINRLRIIYVVNSSHFFFENPYHPMNSCLEKMTDAMNCHYSFESLDLTQVIGGTVCVVFMNGRWLRCMIVHMFPNGAVNIKLLDYGGYFMVPMNHLKQIHQNYLSLPFQAIEAVMHNIKPPYGLQSWSLETQKEHENLLRRNVELIYRGSGLNGIATVDMYLPVGELYKMFWNESLVTHHKADWIVRPVNH